MRGNLHIGANPQAACIAPSAHGRQRVVGAAAFVRIDHARQLADEERAVIAQLLRRCRAGPLCAPADARQRHDRNRRSSWLRHRKRRSRHSRATPCRRQRRSKASRAAAPPRQGRLGQRPVGGDQARRGCARHARPAPSRSVAIISASPVWSATMKISRGPGKLVDADRPEDLPLRLVDEGVARPHDLVDCGHGFRSIGHRGDRLRAADPEDAVGARQMAAGDHCLVRVGRQAGDDLVDSRRPWPERSS